MRSGAHEGLMCPLEKGVRGIEMRQVIRCRAGVGGQGKPCGDGKPVGPDRSLEKGVGGFKTLGTESQYIDDIP